VSGTGGGLTKASLPSGKELLAVNYIPAAEGIEAFLNLCLDLRTSLVQ